MRSEEEIEERIAYIKARRDLPERDKLNWSYLLEWVLNKQ